MPELAILLAFQSIESSKFLNFFSENKMSPLAPCPGFFPSPITTFIASSSKTQFAGIAVPLHWRQPSKFLPLNNNTQPSFFSFFESLFTCEKAVPASKTATSNKIRFFFISFLIFLLCRKIEFFAEKCISF